jgi:hypothetical protein
VIPNLVIGKRLLSRKIPPGLAYLSMSRRSRKENWWQATKLASFFPIR